MTAPAKKSAFPKPMDELIAEVGEWAAELGELPSRNQVMTRCRVGARKASEALAAVKTAPDSSGPVERARRLHAVTDTDRAEDNDTGNDTTLGDLVPAPIGVDADEQIEEADPDRIGTAQDSPVTDTVAATEPGEVTPVADPVPVGRPVQIRRWALLLLAAPAFVAIWSGWVGLGGLTGFGIVHPLPGIWDGFQLNTAITLPVGVETYAAYALRVWLSPRVPGRARRFAKFSAIGSLALGALGQVAYHLMTAAGYHAAPVWITTLVACLPVAVLGMGAALAHLLHPEEESR